MKIRVCYTIALGSYLGLFTLLMLWHTFLVPAQHLPVAFVLFISITPLLLPLRGFLKTNLKSCAWMAYVSLPYFIHGTGEAYSNVDERLYAGLEIFFSLLLFSGSTFFVRFSAQARRL